MSAALRLVECCGRCDEPITDATWDGWFTDTGAPVCTTCMAGSGVLVEDTGVCPECLEFFPWSDWLGHLTVTDRPVCNTCGGTQ